MLIHNILRLFRTLLLCSLPCSSLCGLTVMDKLFEGESGDSITWNLRGNQTKLTITEKQDSTIHLIEESPDQKPLLHIIDRYNVKERSPSSSEGESRFLDTLLRLNLTEIPKENRRKIGSVPSTGNLDVRSLWNPPIIIDEKKYFLPCVAYSVQWPKDETDLAGKKGTLYYTADPAIQALPYWIEIETSPNPVHIRAINSHRHTNTSKLESTP